MAKGKLLGALAFCAGVVVMGGHADAGQKDNTSSLEIQGNNFSGGLGITRNTPDSSEYIGCWTNGLGTAACYARNSVGVFKQCTTSNPAHLLALRSLNGDSYLSVNWNGGSCSAVSVYNDSTYATKNH